MIVHVSEIILVSGLLQFIKYNAVCHILLRAQEYHFIE